MIQKPIVAGGGGGGGGDMYKADNLAGLTSYPTARTNLDVYSKAESEALLEPLEQIIADTKEPHGFNRLQANTMGIIELSCDGTTIFRIEGDGTFTTNNSGNFANGTAFETIASPHTFAIYPASGETEFNFYNQGEKISINGLEQSELTATSGSRYIAFDNNGDIVEIFGMPTIEDYTTKTFISLCYGNFNVPVKVVFADERHGIQMPATTHYYEHTSEGSRYVSGMGIDGLLEGDAEYSGINSGVMFDEDIIHTLPAQTNAPFWYLDGTVRNIIPDGLELAYMGTSHPYYNKIIGGSGSLVEISNGNFTLVHIVATNDAQFPYVKILGQDEYNTLGQARDGALQEVNNLVLAGLATPEIKFVASIILDDNGELRENDLGTTFIDWRETRITGNPGTSGVTNLHANLTDTDTDGHPAEIISYDNSTSQLSATDVQEAIDELEARPASSGRRLLFAIAGAIGSTGTNLGNTFVVDGNYTISKCNMWYGSAGNGILVADINLNGTTIFSTTKPTITSTNQSSIDTGTITTTNCTSGDIFTLDIDSVPATTTPTDLYVELVLV